MEMRPARGAELIGRLKVLRARRRSGCRGLLGGGADVANQYIAAGLVDELVLHVVPVLLGGGARLLENAGEGKLECTQVIESPKVTHLRYRPAR